ncbi:MAG: hypothetical protein LBU04_00535 [Christensenellaceae bacterium]|jgi:transcriptional regulator of arginine metabolism|nr:hypothetical protein [Christensenellaceae bacterium]
MSENEFYKNETIIKAIFSHSIIKIEGIKNIIVIKTISGAASSVGLVIDKMKLADCLGCVAGDDVVLVVIKDKTRLNYVINDLNKFKEASQIEKY